jgi:ribosomal 30S subunit maturation factor RimM
VRKDDRELLIPAAKNFVATVDLVQRRMTVRGIEGLVEDHNAL